MERIPWRERVLLSFHDVGDVFARSPLWVRDMIAAGKLTEHRFPKGNPAVTVQSVLELVDEILATPERGAPPAKPGSIRLAWDRKQGSDELIETILRK